MSDKIPVIILLGAPGAGKGTQADLLSHRRSIPRISTGDMLRHAVQDETELGRRVKEIMNDGKLVDDQTMQSLVNERIHRPDCSGGFILDGYPRNRKQASALTEVLEPNMKLVVFEIEVSDEDILKRVAGRRTCPQCERIYNVYSHPEDRCDFDGEKLIRRNDDREDVVKKRLETYRRETFPLIDFYRQLGALKVVNGVQYKERVAEEILAHL